MSDPVGLLALARAQILSEDVEEQLTARGRDGYRPLAAVLGRARLAAAEALAAIVSVDPEVDPKEIRRLQNEVRRFEDLVCFLRQILLEGRERALEIADAERQELEDLIFSPTADRTAEQMAELARLGINREDNA